MKKTISLLVAILVSLCAMAQTKQHMKFMGIPMGVSITTFHQKLLAKGLKYNQIISKSLPAGVRLYYGTFAGYEASIYSYYDTKDSKVYRSKAVIERESLEDVEQVFYDISYMLLEKYPNGVFNDIDVDKKSLSLSIDLGRIDCYKDSIDGDWTNSYKERYCIHVDYWDSKSLEQHESNKMDDL